MPWIHSIGPETHILGRSGPFRYCTNFAAKLVEMAKLTHKFAKRSCVEIYRNAHLIHSIGPTTHVLGSFRLFCYYTKIDAKQAELVPSTHVRSTKLRRKILQRTQLLHSVGPKTHVLGHSGPFRYYTNVDAKLAEMATLTHKFTERSCVEICRNERTRSTPLDPKLMFGGVSDGFITALKSMQNWPNWCP
jgi:hypothetical protein